MKHPESLLRRPIRPTLRVALCLGLSALPALAAALEIAPLDEALSFARIDGPEGPRVIAVTAYDADTVQGVDLSAAVPALPADPLTLYQTLGYTGVLERIAAAKHPVRVPAAALLQPLALTDRHVAVGTNYPAHADESDVEGGPFLFPKHVVPTPPRAEVSVADRLLDYEVELCFVALQDIAPDTVPPHWGLILCNDFTDRARLLRHIDPGHVESGDGFTTGKSFPGALPVGDLFVIPRQPRVFASTLELRLYRGNELRQQSPVSRAIWDIDEILRQAWARAGQRWTYAGSQVGLFAADGHLPARSLVLSGTPDGTVFTGIHLGQKLRGLGRWLAGGMKRELAAEVIAIHLDDARGQVQYLQPGESVRIEAARLGTIVTRVVP